MVKCVTEFMVARGWHPARQHVGTFRTRYGGWIKMGEKGMADCLFLHPDHGALYIECKRPGRVPDLHQEEWIRSKRLHGFNVWVVDGEKSLIAHWSAAEWSAR